MLLVTISTPQAQTTDGPARRVPLPGFPNNRFNLTIFESMYRRHPIDLFIILDGVPDSAILARLRQLDEGDEQGLSEFFDIWSRIIWYEDCGSKALIRDLQLEKSIGRNSTVKTVAAGYLGSDTVALQVVELLGELG